MSSLDDCGCAWLITNWTRLSSIMASQRASTSETKVIGPTVVRASRPCNHPVRNVNERACVAAKRSVVE
jgi:hypothetical protein